jgi:hypothetical protein
MRPDRGCPSLTRSLHALNKRLVVSLVDDDETPVAVGS